MSREDYHRLQVARYRKKNIVVWLSLLAGVLGIYGYSMYSVQQDPLLLDEILEDSETPPKPS